MFTGQSARHCVKCAGGACVLFVFAEMLVYSVWELECLRPLKTLNTCRVGFYDFILILSINLKTL